MKKLDVLVAIAGLLVIFYLVATLNSIDFPAVIEESRQAAVTLSEEERDALRDLREATEKLRKLNESIQLQEEPVAHKLTFEITPQPQEYTLEFGDETTFYLISFSGPGWTFGVKLDGTTEIIGNAPEDFNVEIWRGVAAGFPDWKQEACGVQNVEEIE